MNSSAKQVASSSPLSVIAGFGFLVVVCSGEYYSYTETPIGFTTDRALADAETAARNAAQKRRRIRNRKYIEVREVPILMPNRD